MSPFTARNPAALSNRRRSRSREVQPGRVVFERCTLRLPGGCRWIVTPLRWARFARRARSASPSATIWGHRPGRVASRHSICAICSRASEIDQRRQFRDPRADCSTTPRSATVGDERASTSRKRRALSFLAANFAPMPCLAPEPHGSPLSAAARAGFARARYALNSPQSSAAAILGRGACAARAPPHPPNVHAGAAPRGRAMRAAPRSSRPSSKFFWRRVWRARTRSPGNAPVTNTALRVDSPTPRHRG